MGSLKRKKPLSRKTPLKAKSPMKKTAKKKPKKKAPSKTSLRNKADKLCRAWFHAAEECVACKVPISQAPACFSCGGNLEWCHLVSRSVGVLRHHPLNAIPMCSAHHRYFTQRPLEFWEFVEKTMPGRSQRLKDLEREIRTSYSKPDYEFWIAWYQNRTDSFRTWDGEI